MMLILGHQQKDVLFDVAMRSLLIGVGDAVKPKPNAVLNGDSSRPTTRPNVYWRLASAPALGDTLPRLLLLPPARYGRQNSSIASHPLSQFRIIAIIEDNYLDYIHMEIR